MSESLLRSERANSISNSNYGSLNASVMSTVNGSEEKMRRRLKYFFMTPCEKYQARGRLPWKLVLQVAKVIVVTLQLYVFGIETSNQVAFIDSTRAALRHLYLQGWDSSWEATTSVHGPFAVYTYDAMFSTIDTALYGYNQTQLALGSFDLPAGSASPTLCIRCFPNLKVDAANFDFQLDKNIVERCFAMEQVRLQNGSSGYDTKRLLAGQNFTLNFDNVQMATLSFNINAIHFNFDAPRLTNAECFLFEVDITFDNQGHSGQVLVSLDTDAITKQCNVNTKRSTSLKEMLYTFLDSAVMLTCALSFLSCLRSLRRGHRMRLNTTAFFRDYHSYELTLDEKLEFINLWFVLIIINDVLTVLGSLLKILIEYKIIYSYIACSLCLGGGAMLVWFGTLRYLGYFAKYNVLLLTIKRSLADVLRFLVCAVVLFLTFSTSRRFYNSWFFILKLSFYYHTIKIITIYCLSTS